jgi:hypothetical protein
MQEYMLSHRILVYGFHQLRWVCKTVQHTDGGKNTKTMEAPVPLSISKDPLALKNPTQSPFSLWDRIVDDYTRRCLTNPTDKLATIAGIAQAFRTTAKADYLAGLWNSDLLRQLYWVVRSGNCARLPYRAPPWSWVSVEGHINCSPYFE